MEIISCESKDFNGIDYIKNLLNEIIQIPLNFLNKNEVLNCNYANSINILFLKDAERF